ncbi:triose-phosphate isomerase [Marinomonas ostreistagni]|uniref:Triosephosphate isomerase n=1 Tax=Marinomonas ostreistagni TaxID=359209 RepID=A0ABS0Z821_9GAMM|nr:triose-phosphate isomerase [Marinomonas ostreistagni]MBJ7549805.1 triose-phosphate isomerase [Marinomonas ostreistagni]
MARRKIVAGNWKMNGSVESVVELVKGLEAYDTVDVIVAPTFVYLPIISETLKNSEIKLAAQTVSEFASGAYTGEVSLSMLKDFAVSHVILGHSERRSLFLETDAQVAEKVLMTLDAGLTPILCVGETLEQREAGTTLEVCNAQVNAVLEKVGVELFEKVVIAYEPVWAIGTGKSATSEQAQEVHKGIRNNIAEKSIEIAQSVAILYGGSVKASNSAELFAQPDIDGALVGGASLDAKEFNSIIESAK